MAGDAAVSNLTLSSPCLQPRPFENPVAIGPPICRDQLTAQTPFSILVPLSNGFTTEAPGMLRPRANRLRRERTRAPQPRPPPTACAASPRVRPPLLARESHACAPRDALGRHARMAGWLLRLLLLMLLMLVLLRLLLKPPPPPPLSLSLSPLQPHRPLSRLLLLKPGRRPMVLLLLMLLLLLLLPPLLLLLLPPPPQQPLPSLPPPLMRKLPRRCCCRSMHLAMLILKLHFGYSLDYNILVHPHNNLGKHPNAAIMYFSLSLSLSLYTYMNPP